MPIHDHRTVNIQQTWQSWREHPHRCRCWWNEEEQVSRKKRIAQKHTLRRTSFELIYSIFVFFPTFKHTPSTKSMMKRMKWPIPVYCSLLPRYKTLVLSMKMSNNRAVKQKIPLVSWWSFPSLLYNDKEYDDTNARVRQSDRYRY